MRMQNYKTFNFFVLKATASEYIDKMFVSHFIVVNNFYTTPVFSIRLGNIP